MDNDQIDKLLHSYISGTITPQESRQLEAWGDESEENRQILDLIEGHSDLGSELSRMYRYDKEKVWRRVCEEDRRYMRRSRLLRSLRIGAAAAVLAGMLVSGALLYQAAHDRRTGGAPRRARTLVGGAGSSGRFGPHGTQRTERPDRDQR